MRHAAGQRFSFAASDGLNGVDDQQIGLDIRRLRKDLLQVGFTEDEVKMLCEKYGIPYGDENHRGLTDCICTVQLLYALVEKFGPQIING